MCARHQIAVIQAVPRVERVAECQASTGRRRAAHLGAAGVAFVAVVAFVAAVAVVVADNGPR